MKLNSRLAGMVIYNHKEVLPDYISLGFQYYSVCGYKERSPIFLQGKLC